MKSFAEYRKTLTLIELGIVTIPIISIKCQFNPDFEDVWLKICGDYKIESTPYYHYLTTGSIDKYIELFRGYGRTEGWITQNIIKFKALTEDISKNGIKELPIVLVKPIIHNEHNDEYEVWEGHRRLSIALFNGIQQKVLLCRIA